MIIDKILDRYDAEKYGDFEYNAHDFYFEVFQYGDIGDDITMAMDYGTEEDVKQALTRYILQNEYNPLIIGYIWSRVWLDNTSEPQTFINISHREV